MVSPPQQSQSCWYFFHSSWLSTEKIPQESRGLCAFYYLALKVIQLYFCQSVFIKTITNSLPPLYDLISERRHKSPVHQWKKYQRIGRHLNLHMTYSWYNLLCYQVILLILLKTFLHQCSFVKTAFQLPVHGFMTINAKCAQHYKTLSSWVFSSWHLAASFHLRANAVFGYAFIFPPLVEAEAAPSTQLWPWPQSQALRMLPKLHM